MSKKAENLLNVDVCATSNWSDTAGAYFVFVNATGTTVTVSKNGSDPFPFETPGGGDSFPVPSGTYSCRLISIPGTYKYNSGPCPGKGNPKTVVIT